LANKKKAKASFLDFAQQTVKGWGERNSKKKKEQRPDSQQIHQAKEKGVKAPQKKKSENKAAQKQGGIGKPSEFGRWAPCYDGGKPKIEQRKGHLQRGAAKILEDMWVKRRGERLIRNRREIHL